MEPVRLAAVVAQALGALVLVALLFVGEGQRIPFFSASPFTVKALFTDAGGLNAGKRPAVTVAGVKLGTVSSVEYQDGHATATLSLDPSAAGKIFTNARVLITPRSALNDLTVDVIPGTPSAGRLRSGATINESHTTGPTNLDRLAEVMTADVRSNLIVLISELNIGLGGRSHSLREAIAELAPFVQTTTLVTRAMDDRRVLLSRLVGDLNVMFGALASRGQQLREMIQTGQTTFGTIAARQQQLAAAMARLAPTFTAVDAAMHGTTQLAPPLVAALHQLEPFAQRLPAGLGALRALVPQGLGLSSDLASLASRGSASVGWLRALLRQLGPDTVRLLPSVQKLTPIVRGLDEYPSGIGELGSNFSGIFSGQNANGPTLRAYGFFEPPRPENFGFPAGAPAPQRTLDTELASLLDKVCLRINGAACIARLLTPGLPKLTQVLR